METLLVVYELKETTPIRNLLKSQGIKSGLVKTPEFAKQTDPMLCNHSVAVELDADTAKALFEQYAVPVRNIFNGEESIGGVSENIRLFVENPQDEYGNICHPRCVISAIVDGDELHIVQPQSFQKKWPSVMKWYFQEVSGVPAGDITFDVWSQFTGFVRGAYKRA